MAYANWIQPSKVSGSGNDTVSISALSDNTGRSSRSTNVTFKAANCPDVVRSVQQSGKPEFVSFSNASAAIDASGGTLTITGKSNSEKLTFSLGSNNGIGLVLPASYTAAGITTTNDSSISGDPGNTAEYNFSITFAGIAPNTTISDKVSQVIVTDAAGNTATCTVTQAAGDATLDVSPASITLDWDAFTSEQAVSFTVTSNTSWTVE